MKQGIEAYQEEAEALIHSLINAEDEAYHAHSTPLHQAALAGHEAAIRLLVERGARLDIRDTLFDGTPLDWAVYGERDEVASYLRSRE